MIKLRTAAGLRDTKFLLRTSSGLRSISAIQIRTSSGLRTVYSLSGTGGNDTLIPDEVDGFGYSKTPISVTTSYATVSAPSGSSIVWNFTDAGWAATNPSSAMSAFRKTVGANLTESTQVTATVTNGGSSFTTNPIIATVTNNYGDQ